VGTDSIQALAQALLNNPLGVINALDNAIGALTHLRAAVQKGDQDDLQKRLSVAFEDREKWLNERHRAQWDISAEKSDLPKASDALKRFFVGDRFKNKKK
jgi:hypothetical protein